MRPASATLWLHTTGGRDGGRHVRLPGAAVDDASLEGVYERAPNRPTFLRTGDRLPVDYFKGLHLGSNLEKRAARCRVPGSMLLFDSLHFLAARLFDPTGCPGIMY